MASVVVMVGIGWNVPTLGLAFYSVKFFDGVSK